MGKQVITVADITKAAESGVTTLKIRQEDCIVTPGAWDKIEELGMAFADDAQSTQATDHKSATKSADKSFPPPNTKKTQICQSRIQGITDQVCSLLQKQLPVGSTHGLETLVKKIVEKKLSCAAEVQAAEQNSVLTTHGGISLISGNKVLEESNGPEIPGKVSISDAIRCHADSPHLTTYMQWEKASFSRTTEAPEINLIVEGELHITVDGRTLSAQAGDILYLNKGSVVNYGTPSRVKLACINI